MRKSRFPKLKAVGKLFNNFLARLFAIEKKLPLMRWRVARFLFWLLLPIALASVLIYVAQVATMMAVLVALACYVIEGILALFVALNNQISEDEVQPLLSEDSARLEQQQRAWREDQRKKVKEAEERKTRLQAIKKNKAKKQIEVAAEQSEASVAIKKKFDGMLNRMVGNDSAASNLYDAAVKSGPDGRMCSIHENSWLGHCNTFCFHNSIQRRVQSNAMVGVGCLDER